MGKNKKMKKFREILMVVLVLSLCFNVLWNQSEAEGALVAEGEDYYADTPAHLAYTLKNVQYSGCRIQNFYVTSNYVYTTQRIAASGDGERDDVLFSRFTINEAQKTATYKDSMKLLNCGHGEILDRYSYNGIYYFLVGTKPYVDTQKNIWSIQVGRVKYAPGTGLNYTKVCRLAGLSSANKSGKSAGEATRVAAATSGDDTQLAIRTELTGKDGNFIQYSTYDLKKVNALLDKVENKTDNYLLFGGNASLKSACNYSFTQKKGKAVQPNGSFQGMEISGAYIYVAGGREGGSYPKIAKINRANGEFVHGSNIVISVISNNSSIVLKGKEMEGVCCRDTKMYFGVINGSEQSIHYINKF